MVEFYQFQMQDGIIIPVCSKLCSRGISGCVYLPEAIYLHATHGTWHATARSGSGQPTENYVSKIKKIVKHLQVYFSEFRPIDVLKYSLSHKKDENRLSCSFEK